MKWNDIDVASLAQMPSVLRACEASQEHRKAERAAIHDLRTKGLSSDQAGIILTRIEAEYVRPERRSEDS